MEKMFIERNNEIITFDDFSSDAIVWLVELYRDGMLIDSRFFKWSHAKNFYVAMTNDGFNPIPPRVMTGKHDCDIFDAVHLIPTN